MKEHVIASIKAAESNGIYYDSDYKQFVLVPGIALRMANADRKMSKGKLLLRKGQKHVD